MSDAHQTSTSRPSRSDRPSGRQDRRRRQSCQPRTGTRGEDRRGRCRGDARPAPAPPNLTHRTELHSDITRSDASHSDTTVADEFDNHTLQTLRSPRPVDGAEK